MANQGATGENHDGQLGMGLVSTAAPDYSGQAGKLWPMSLDANGNLRVSAGLAAGSEVIGLVGTPGDVIQVALSLDTSAYADGDVLADLQEVANFVRANGGRAIIQSITVLDKDDQGIAMDLFVSPLAVTLGTENSGPSISDANAEGLQHICRVEAGDYLDLGGCRIATKRGLGVTVEAGAATRSMYVGAITRGAPTHSAAGIVLLIGLLWF